MTLKVIEKQLAGTEDLAIGKSTVSQIRNDTAYTIHEIDLHVCANNTTIMRALDITKYHACRVYADATNFTDYMYDATRSDGLSSDTGPGSWINVSFSAISRASAADLANVSSAINLYGKYTGKVVYNTTAAMLVAASGASAASVWKTPLGDIVATTAELADVDNAINTTGKYTGKTVYDTTAQMPKHASGASAAAAWKGAWGDTTAGTADLSDIDDAINTAGKYAGKVVVTFSDDVYVAKGPAAADPWLFVDTTVGSKITPA